MIDRIAIAIVIHDRRVDRRVDHTRRAAATNLILCNLIQMNVRNRQQLRLPKVLKLANDKLKLN